MSVWEWEVTEREEKQFHGCTVTNTESLSVGLCEELTKAIYLFTVYSYYQLLLAKLFLNVILIKRKELNCQKRRYSGYILG